MSAHVNLRSIELTVENRQPISTATTDYSLYLRQLAGVNTPSIICSSVSITFDLLFTLITLVVGTTNLSACPAEPRIPIYLIVSACVNLLSIAFTILACLLHWWKRDGNLLGFFCVISAAVIIILLQFFNFVWLIVGSVWVFGIRPSVQWTSINAENYCQGNLYQYTFISIILQYILPWLICCCKNIPWKK